MGVRQDFLSVLVLYNYKQKPQITANRIAILDCRIVNNGFLLDTYISTILRDHVSSYIRSTHAHVTI